MLLARTLAAVGFFEYAFMFPCDASLAWWTILGADTFHLETSADSTCSSLR